MTNEAKYKIHSLIAQYLLDELFGEPYIYEGETNEN